MSFADAFSHLHQLKPPSFSSWDVKIHHGPVSYLLRLSTDSQEITKLLEAVPHPVSPPQACLLSCPGFPSSFRWTWFLAGWPSLSPSSLSSSTSSTPSPPTPPRWASSGCHPEGYTDKSLSKFPLTFPIPQGWRSNSNRGLDVGLHTLCLWRPHRVSHISHIKALIEWVILVISKPS